MTSSSPNYDMNTITRNKSSMSVSGKQLYHKTSVDGRDCFVPVLTVLDDHKPGSPSSTLASSNDILDSSDESKIKRKNQCLLCGLVDYESLNMHLRDYHKLNSKNDELSLSTEAQIQCHDISIEWGNRYEEYLSTKNKNVDPSAQRKMICQIVEGIPLKDIHLILKNETRNEMEKYFRRESDMASEAIEFVSAWIGFIKYLNYEGVLNEEDGSVDLTIYFFNNWKRAFRKSILPKAVDQVRAYERATGSFTIEKNSFTIKQKALKDLSMNQKTGLGRERGRPYYTPEERNLIKEVFDFFLEGNTLPRMKTIREIAKSTGLKHTLGEKFHPIKIKGCLQGIKNKLHR